MKNNETFEFKKDGKTYTAKVVKVEEENKLATFVNDVNSFKLDIVKGEIDNACQVGGIAVPDKYRGRCLVLDAEIYEWQIIDNPDDEDSKLLIAKKIWE